MRKIYQLNSQLHHVTGLQRVLMDIHEALGEFNPKIVGTLEYDRIPVALGVKKDDYIKFSGYGMFRNSLLIVHERRYLPVIWLLNKLFRYDIRAVYIHHNELHGYKHLSLFPKNVVAISDSGIKNLTGEFGVPECNITKIHNCVRRPENMEVRHKVFDSKDITILYPARIEPVKRQLELVKRMRGKLDHRVRILFAGSGSDYDSLAEECAGSEQLQVLGFREDVVELMQKSDFVMLFSQFEGLPISLIEATMTGTPIICNNVGGNTEIAVDGVNSFIINDADELIQFLNRLPERSNLPEQLGKMSEESVKMYDRYFRFEIFKQNYVSYIKSIANEP